MFLRTLQTIILHKIVVTSSNRYFLQSYVFKYHVTVQFCKLLYYMYFSLLVTLLEDSYLFTLNYLSYSINKFVLRSTDFCLSLVSISIKQVNYKGFTSYFEHSDFNKFKIKKICDFTMYFLKFKV